MRAKHEGLKNLLRASVDGNGFFNKDLKALKDLGQDLGHLTSDLCSIADGYTSTFRAAERLTQRDWTELMQGVRIYERQFLEEQAKVEAANKLIQEKDQFIGDLNKTLRDIVHFLGSFIQDNMDNPPEEVMQLIADYASTDSDPDIPYVRMPEVSFNNMLRKNTNAQIGLDEYRAIAADQHTLIKDQSDQVTKHTEKYERSLLALKAKDDEIVALGAECETVKASLAEYENAVGLSRDGTPVHGEALTRYIASLKVQVDTLANSIATRDTQIESLLAQLRNRGRSWRSPVVKARTESVDFSSLSSTSTARQALLLGQQQEGIDDSKLKRSNSTSATVFRGKSRNYTPPLSKHRRSASVSSSIYSQDGAETMQPNDPFQSPQPRSDSLGALRALQKFGRSQVTDLHQRLTRTPSVLGASPSAAAAAPSSSSSASVSASSSYTARGRGVARHEDSSSPVLTSRRHSTQFRSASEHVTPSTTARSGMLSDIPEAPAEGSGGESPRALSTTSSDREVYRRSMSALYALNQFADGSASTTTSPNRNNNTSSGSAAAAQPVQDEAEKLSSEESEPLTVSEMYHEGTHHLES
ncbi:hypothetical protein DV735_g5842, partial [Chaetothyriales sp. CBS 134920]